MVSSNAASDTYSDGRPALRALVPTITNLAEIGLNLEKVSEAASLDEGIAEFSRFYLERREQEVRFAGNDERKSQKLYDEFTPRFEATGLWSPLKNPSSAFHGRRNSRTRPGYP